MISGNAKKFFIFVCLVLTMFAAFQMTPEEHSKKLLQPLKSLYNSEEGDGSETPKDYFDSPKMVVKPDDAKKTSLNVEVDPAHPGQVLPVADKNVNVDNLDFEDSSQKLGLEDEKTEAILESAPLV